MKDRSDDPSHHERTLLPRSYISLQLEDLYSRYMNGSDAYDRCAGHDTRQLHPSCISCSRLPISQDWLDRMKLVRNRTVPIILPSGMNILADTMFKITVRYTNLGMSQIQYRLVCGVCSFVTPNANMAGYPRKI